MGSPTQPLGRRAVLRRAGGGLALLVLSPLTAAVQACGKKELSCADSAGMSFSDAQTRVTYQYTDRALDPSKPCRTCRQFRSAGEQACGRCEVVKGPIHPAGGCRAWAPRT